MTTYLADSDVIIDYFNQKEPSTGIIFSLLQSDAVVISAITLHEVRRGWDERQAQKLRHILYALFPIVDVSASIADYAGELWKRHSMQGRTLSTADTLIAATAIKNNFCLLTRNVKDYPMPEIRLYKDLFTEQS